MKAIILCAGEGRRFQPLSYFLPKPLTPINNVPLLQRVVKLLHKNAVTDITVVVGHLAQCFEPLAAELNLKLVFNPDYARANNNTSLAKVAHLLDDALIIDGDLYFVQDFFPYLKPNVSQYVTQPTTYGLEWELMLNEQDQVVSVDKWSPKGFGMVGVSYWVGEGARLLAEELPQCAADEYWEDASLRVLQRTPVYAAKIESTFLREVDCLRDALNLELLTHEEIAHLCSPGFTPQKLKGLTNNTWLIRGHEGNMLTLRVPGKGTDRYIRREHEPIILHHIKDMGITPATNFYPGGFKTTHFLDQHRVSTPRDCTPAYHDALAALLRPLHAIPHNPKDPLKPLYIAEDIALYEEQSGRRAEPRLREWLLTTAKAFDEAPQVLCHRDLLQENILVSGALASGDPAAPAQQGTHMQLIDFEYAGFTHPLWDVASFILESGIEGEVRRDFMRACGVLDQEEALKHMEILVDYVWGLWGLVNNYDEYGATRLHRGELRLRTLLGLADVTDCEV